MFRNSSVPSPRRLRWSRDRVGQIVNLRRIANPPARCGSERARVGGVAAKVRQAGCQPAAGSQPAPQIGWVSRPAAE